jgi:hypothetical protein
MATIIKRKMNWRNFWICFSISMGQLAFGYPSSIIGTTLGQPSFLLYMGLITPEGLETDNANGLIGATSGVFQVSANGLQKTASDSLRRGLSLEF